MRQAIRSAVLCGLIVIMMTGCSRSPRVAYYSLESAARPEAGHIAHKELPVVSVETPTLPELVDRPQLVERLSANRIEILELHRWAEPLKSSVSRMLADNLSRLLESDRVSAYPQNAGSAAAYRVYVDFQRFESEGTAVSVDALWTIRRTADGEQKTGRVRIHEPTGGEGYEAVIAAYNRALAAVSSDIAQVLRMEWGASLVRK